VSRHDEVDQVLIDTVERILRARATQDDIERAEGDGGWSAGTWAALAEVGFPWVGIDAARGGSGGSLADAAALALAVGHHAAPVPLAETSIVGGWLLAEAGIALPEGPVSAVAAEATVEDERVRVDGVAAFGRHAHRIVVAAGDRVFALHPEQVAVEPGANLAGEARDRIRADVEVDEVEHGSVTGAFARMRARGALSRVVMAAGALEALSQMTVDYTNQRRQFGQPVARFQAVQQHLVVTAQSAVRARMAADIAVRSLASGDAGIDIAAARVVTDDAIALGTRAAHQAHGAMGVTREYALHQLSRRLWSWRHEWDSTKAWRRELGRAIAATSADDLFSVVTR
jgi:acyl-CoA dehydrogenase